MFQYDIFFSLSQTRWLSDIFGVFSFILGSDGWCTIGVANCSRRYLTYCGSAPLQSLHPWAQNQQFSRFCCSYPFEALLKNTSFLTAHFSWTLNIGFNCQPVRLPLYNHGGGKGKGCFYYDWKEKACKLHRSLGACLRACFFSIA